MTRALLPIFAELVRVTHMPQQSGASVITTFTYRDQDNRELSYMVDQRAQQLVLEANQVETKLMTRILGSIIAIDYDERALKIRSDQFPEQPLWCDAGGLDFDELERFVSRDRYAPPKIIAIEAEVAWRRGAANQFPPEAIRIIAIFPEEDFMKLLPPARPGLIRQPIYEMDIDRNRSRGFYKTTSAA
jgi:hypothetical protein